MTADRRPTDRGTGTDAESGTDHGTDRGTGTDAESGTGNETGTGTEVAVEVAGEGSTTVALDAGATYADLARELDYSPHEVSVLVEDRPVPADQPVAASEVTLVRLVKGG